MAPLITIAQALEEAAKSAPTRGFRFVPEAGVPGTRGAENSAEASFSFTAIERASARYGGALQAFGMKQGERVALILPTNEDFILCFFGAIRAGIIPVPIYPPLGIGGLQGYLDNTRHIVQKSGARVLVTTAKIKRLLGTVQASCPALEEVVAVEAIRESMEPLKPAKIKLDDVAFLQFTSGSTSRPKGVTLTHANLAANMHAFTQEGLKLKDDDVGVSWLPLFHDMGLIGFVIAPVVYKIPMVYLPSLLFLKRPASWLQAISRHKGTISYGPNFAYALCMKRIKQAELEGIDLSSWRVAGIGAEPIRPETIEAFSETFAKVGFKKEAFVPSYGMAEASLAVAFAGTGRGARTLGVDGPTLWSEGIAKIVDETAENAVRLVACGPAFQDHELKIFADGDVNSASPLPDDHVGEIRISGPSVMKGYWEDAEMTRDAFAGPFLKTGDLGFLHEGDVYICGRSKEVVIINGRNYYPQDMEWETSQVAGVRKGNVIAFGAREVTGKDTDRERVVVAFELDANAGVAPEAAGPIISAIRKAVQEGIGLTLDDVVPLPAGVLPKTSSGKLQRAKTRALYESGELKQLTSRTEGTRVDLMKEAARSQLSYLRLAVLGGRKKT
ncbi:MAG: fatty acyl-AMP ligase [Polyangiaceae bacterium]